MWLSKSVIVKPRKMRRPRPPRGCRAIEKNRGPITRYTDYRFIYSSLARYGTVSSDRSSLFHTSSVVQTVFT
jgi:hypothetical protein